MMDYFRSVAVADVEADGRNLHGHALELERDYDVTDPGRGRYRERHGRKSFDRSIGQRGREGRWPLLMLHPFERGARTSPVPLGSVRWFIDGGRLAFHARASATRDADEALELVRDGALGDVSIGAREVEARTLRDSKGSYLYRTESALRELSLAPTGFGAYDDAKVLAVRATPLDAGTPRLEALRRRRRLLTLP